MEQTIIYLALVLVGLCLGSFAGAMLWRLRARQLRDDKEEGEHINEREYARLEKLTRADPLHDRSQCLHCSYTLKWYDMIPLLSWLTLRGKCRSCRHKIGKLEPLLELGVALFFIVSYVFWPYALDSPLSIVHFIAWLMAGVALAILFAYDKKWFLLPDIPNFVLVGLGVVISAVTVIQATDRIGATVSVLGGIAILSGLYLILYYLSKGRWIGFGDIKLGLGLALILADWRLAFISLFAANLIGCLIVIPGMIAGKLKRNSHIAFGPLLIAGAVVAQFIGPYLIDAYLFGLL
jgi:prepilin signal peptidase PulO-like enzyme (type II secretory pathway)